MTDQATDKTKTQRSRHKKLDAEKAQKIRLLASQLDTKALAERFGVHKNTILDVLAGRCWP